MNLTSGNLPLRPIGTEFEEYTETTRARIIRRYRVVAHDDLTEITQLINEIRQPKTILGGKERK